MNLISRTNNSQANSNNNNIYTQAIQSKDALMKKVALPLYVLTATQVPVPKSTGTTTISTYVPVEQREQELLDATWTTIAKQIKDFVATAFKDKKDGCQTFTDSNVTFCGLVANKLPTSASITFLNGIFRGFFHNGIPQHYGHITTDQLFFDAYFHNGQPTGYCEITFINKTINRYFIDTSLDQQLIVPENIDLILAFNEFFSHSAQPLSDGENQNFENKYGFFEGSIVDGKPVSGYVFVKGFLYKGSFQDELPHGKGKIETATYVYQGDFENGKKHGEGIYKNHMNQFEGKFKNDVADGKGICFYGNGDQYNGHFENFKRKGVGELKIANGEFYTGNWDDDMRHGTGTLYYPDGNIFFGTWEYGKVSGHGTFIYLDVGKYEGTWVNNQRQSRGKMTYKNGDVYEGHWLNDKRNGYGTMTYKDGTTKTCRWENNAIANIQDTAESSSCPVQSPRKTPLQENMMPDSDDTATFGTYIEANKEDAGGPKKIKLSEQDLNE
jgi:hypothetical protein